MFIFWLSVLEYSDLSAMIENVDAALDALESQSDELFDEVKLMLEEVRKDNAGLDSDINRAAHSASKSQTDQEDCKKLEGTLSDLCVSEDIKNASAAVTSCQGDAASDAAVEGKDVNESVASSSKMESGKKTTKS